MERHDVQLTAWSISLRVAVPPCVADAANPAFNLVVIGACSIRFYTVGGLSRSLSTGGAGVAAADATAMRGACTVGVLVGGSRAAELGAAIGGFTLSVTVVLQRGETSLRHVSATTC